MEERKFSEQELVRREKMQELIDKGIDPFGQRFDVTAYSKDIKEQLISLKIIQSQYVNRNQYLMYYDE